MSDTSSEPTTKKQVVSSLYDLTRRGDLTWEETSWEEISENEARSVGGAASETDPAFTATYRGMTLYLFGRGGDEGGEEKRTLQVAGPETGASVSFPAVEGLEDLHELIRFRTRKVQSWMEEVVRDATSEPTEEASTEEASTEEESHEESADASGSPDGLEKGASEDLSTDDEELQESGSGVFDAEEGSFDANGDEAEGGIL